MTPKSAQDRPTVKTATWKGIPIALEFIKGQHRHGRELPMHYGYFPDSELDNDGDHVDVFLTADPHKADVAFIINQVKPTGSFDEPKVVLGFATAQEAKEAYLSCYKDDFTGFGSIVAVTPYQLQWWLENGDIASTVDALDFLPNGTAAKRAMDFTPDYTPCDMNRFGLMSHRKTAWLEWYDGFTQGIRTPQDEERVSEWKAVVRKNASLLRSVYDTEAMNKLVRYAVDPIPLLPRPYRKQAGDNLERQWHTKYAADKKPIIAVDLDGTLAEALPEHDDAKIGPVKKDMAVLVMGLKALGCVICIWTVRDNRRLVAEHLRDAHVPFDYINDSPFNPESGSRKIYADVYLDDRAVRAEGSANSMLRRIIDILRVEDKLK